MTNYTKFPFYQNLTFKLIDNGIDKFFALFEDIANAQKFIYLNYFIIHDGYYFKAFEALLIRKYREGVKIYLILDHFGSWFGLFNKNLRNMKNIGIEICFYNYVTWPFFSYKTNYRCHRKDVIIDGVIGYTGGYNIGDNYINLSAKYGCWQDMQVRITGGAVTSLALIFLKDWYELTKQHLPLPILLKNNLLSANLDLTTINFNQVIGTGPHITEIIYKDLLLKFINTTQQRIWISTPYLIVPNDIVIALKNAAISGVDVRILMPNVTDKILLLDLSRTYYDDLLLAGVKIYESSHVFNHAKTILFDDDFSLVTTSNMDYRSFFHDHQTSMMTFGLMVNQTLANIFMQNFSLAYIVQAKHFTLKLPHKVMVKLLLLFEALL